MCIFNWYALLKWLQCISTLKSLSGKKLPSVLLELCYLTLIFTKILKNLEVVCMSKIITDPVSRATVIQAIASSRSSWRLSATTPNRKVLSYLQFSTSFSETDDNTSVVIQIQSWIRCERKFLLIWKQTWRNLPRNRTGSHLLSKSWAKLNFKSKNITFTVPNNFT